MCSYIVVTYVVFYLQCGFTRLSNINSLNQFFKPTHYGSPGLIDTSSFIDPYRTDISRFRPYLYGYIETTTATLITTQTFDECMEKCIQNFNCKAFDINMIILPFRCKLSVKPCPNGSCQEFKSHPYWKHFIRDDDNTQILQPSIISLNSLDGKYKTKQLRKVNSFSIELELNNTLFEYIEITVPDISSHSIYPEYIWFEYKRTSTSNWLKCQRVQLPQISTTYQLLNKCIQYEFEPFYQSQCNVLKESWEYHPITTQTKKIGNIFLENSLIPNGNSGISLKECNDNLLLNPTRNTKIYYEKLGPVHAVRLFTHVGKFEVQKMEAKLFKHSISTIDPVSIVTQFGENDFQHPNDEWYYDILKDGGYLWCRNPSNSPNNVLGGTNVFKGGRMHHSCYYRGSTLSKTTKTSMSDKERIHYFNSDQCSFDINDIPNCKKAWVEIEENCQGWQYCTTCLNQATNITIYHKHSLTHSMLNGQNIDFPIISWMSGWNRAQSQDSELSWSIDYETRIFLVLHDCINQFDEMSGCSQCGSSYFEAQYNPSITVQNLRIYKYETNEQYCRPQPNIWENQCESETFCPKGALNTDFQDNNYWSCRTNSNGEQRVINGFLNTMEKVNQGFGCTVH